MCILWVKTTEIILNYPIYKSMYKTEGLILITYEKALTFNATIIQQGSISTTH